jgi:LemA protein
MKKLSTGKIVLISLASIFLILILWSIGSYNGLVKSRETVTGQQANIETQLQRRVDLIPNLVNTVKGYASHETQIMTQISEARAKLSGAKSMSSKAEADTELNSTLSRLLVIAENYPELKADAQFKQLQDELAGTENRIAVARNDYNNAAKSYNQSIKTFPNIIFANLFGFSAEDYFQAAQGAEKAPSVDFGK